MTWNTTKIFRSSTLAAMLVVACCSVSTRLLAAGHLDDPTGADWMAFFELPFLLITIIYGFRTASALKGGAFGRGMGFIAWGAVVMGIGHMHMQIDQMYHFNLFARLLGPSGGAIAFLVALIVTWVLTGSGFYSIYKASSKG